MITKQAKSGIQLFIIGNDHTTFTGGDVLDGVEAKNGHVGKGSNHFVFILCPECMASIRN